MIRSRFGLAAIVAAILLASCGGRPSVTVSIADQMVNTTLTSTTETTGCTTSHGDGPFDRTVTTVRALTPVTLTVEAGQGATRIRGWIYDIEAPRPSGGPIEEFTLPGHSGVYEPRSIVPARTYEVVVNVAWSALITRGEVTHVFRVRVEPPR